MKLLSFIFVLTIKIFNSINEKIPWCALYRETNITYSDRNLCLLKNRFIYVFDLQFIVMRFF